MASLPLLEQLSGSASAWFPMLLDVAAKGTVILILTGILALAMRRAPAATRHMVWLLGTCSLLVLPVLSATLPGWHILPQWTGAAREPAPVQLVSQADAGAASAYSVPQFEASIPEAQPAIPELRTEVAEYRHAPMDSGSWAQRHAISSLSWQAWALLAWAGGTLILLATIAGGNLSLRWLEHRSARVTDEGWLSLLSQLCAQLGIGRRVDMLCSAQRTMPMTWGLWRARILLPAGADVWSPAQRRAVLLHELAHAKRWDCIWQLAVQLACALYWFNPLIWLSWRRIQTERERACDDLVLCSGTKASAYAEQLLHIAEEMPTVRYSAAAIAMARPGTLEGRLRAILDSTRNRSRLAMTTAITIAIIVGASATFLAVLRAEAANGTPATTRPAATQPAATPTRSATQPVVDKLPVTIPKDRFALRVVDQAGSTIDIVDIRSIFVIQGQGSKWLMGPKPEVLSRFADGWVFVDRSMLALAWPGRKVEMTFQTATSGAMIVIADFPNDNSTKLTFTAPDPKSVGIDTSAGPANVATDEVAGQVVDQSGKPVAGAVVSLPRYVPKVPDFRPAVTTGSDGTFRFPSFANQWYLVLQVEKPGYAIRWIADIPIGKGFLVHLDNTTRFRGELTLPNGKPADGAAITLTTAKATARPRIASPISDLTLTAKADALGRYDILVDPGEYDLRVEASGGVFHIGQAIEKGQTLSFPGQLETGVSFSVRVVDSVTGRPIPGAKLEIEDRRPGFIYPREGSERSTDEQGVANWEGVLPGLTAISFREDGYTRWWTAADRSAHSRMTIDFIRLDLRRGMPQTTIMAEPGMRVSGQVLSPDGQSVAGANVDVAGLITGDSRYAKTTDAQGRFSLCFPNLEQRPTSGPANWTPNKYAVVAFDPSGRWANVVSEQFLATPGGERTFTLVMTPGGRVQGRVIDEEGHPVPSIEVEASATDGMDRNYFNPRTLTDEQGRFDLGQMRPATYLIQPDIFFGVNIMQEPRQQTKQVQIKDGQTVQIGDLLYKGPPVPPVPDYYRNMFGMRKPASQPATTQPNVAEKPVTEAAAGSQPGATSVSESLEWGEAVEGVAASLRAQRERWAAGEAPAFVAAVRYDGQRQDLAVYQTEDTNEIQWDGVWYHWAGATEAKSSWLPPGRQYDGISFSLGTEGGGWRDKDGRAPQLSSGKHQVRIAFDVAESGSWKQVIRAISNPVGVEIAAGSGLVATQPSATHPIAFREAVLADLRADKDGAVIAKVRPILAPKLEEYVAVMTETRRTPDGKQVGLGVRVMGRRRDGSWFGREYSLSGTPSTRPVEISRLNGWPMPTEQDLLAWVQDKLPHSVTIGNRDSSQTWKVDPLTGRWNRQTSGRIVGPDTILAHVFTMAWEFVSPTSSPPMLVADADHPELIGLTIPQAITSTNPPQHRVQLDVLWVDPARDYVPVACQQSATDRIALLTTYDAYGKLADGTPYPTRWSRDLRPLSQALRQEGLNYISESRLRIDQTPPAAAWFQPPASVSFTTQSANDPATQPTGTAQQNAPWGPDGRRHPELATPAAAFRSATGVLVRDPRIAAPSSSSATTRAIGESLTRPVR